jgi:hypothetical protein
MVAQAFDIACFESDCFGEPELRGERDQIAFGKDIVSHKVPVVRNWLEPAP